MNIGITTQQKLEDAVRRICEPAQSAMNAELKLIIASGDVPLGLMPMILSNVALQLFCGTIGAAMLDSRVAIALTHEVNMLLQKKFQDLHPDALITTNIPAKDRVVHSQTQL